MNDTVTGLIDSIAKEDTVSSAQIFNDLMMSRVSTLVDSRRAEVAKTMFTPTPEAE